MCFYCLSSDLMMKQHNKTVDSLSSLSEKIEIVLSILKNYEL